MASFLEGELTPGVDEVIRLHVAQCDDCRILLATSVRSVRELSAPRGADAGFGQAGVGVRSWIDGLLPPQGTLLAGKYRLDRLLGAGGMGYVVAATNVSLDQRVAIKLLLPSVAEVPGAVERFVREARAAAKLESEHVVRILDVALLPNGTTYIVMEYLEGTDLRELLETQGPRPLAEASSWVVQACEGLAHAHAAGIVHRDLKPANLFAAARRDGSAVLKILDFGVAKVRERGSDSSGGASTAPGIALGTPVYMSPEQLRGSADTNEASDIWALGAILFELVSGETPFSAASMTALCAKILESKAPSLCARRPEVPREVDVIVARCLAKDPARRFADVGELAHALAPFCEPETRALVARTRRVLASRGGGSSPAGLTVARTQRPRRRWLVGGTVALTALGVGSAGLLGSRSGRQPTPGESMVALPAASTHARAPATESSNVALSGHEDVVALPAPSRAPAAPTARPVPIAGKRGGPDTMPPSSATTVVIPEFGPRR